MGLNVPSVLREHHGKGAAGGFCAAGGVQTPQVPSIEPQIPTNMTYMVPFSGYLGESWSGVSEIQSFGSGFGICTLGLRIQSPGLGSSVMDCSEGAAEEFT